MFLRVAELAVAVLLAAWLFGWVILPYFIKLYRRLRNGKSGQK